MRNNKDSEEVKLARRNRNKNSFVANAVRKVIDNRVTTCSECRRGIFQDQERVWSSTGLVHAGCDETKNTA